MLLLSRNHFPASPTLPGRSPGNWATLPGRSPGNWVRRDRRSHGRPWVKRLISMCTAVLSILAGIFALGGGARLLLAASPAGVEVVAVVGGGQAKQFSSPTGVAALPGGGWAVADSSLGQVRIVSSAGKITRTIGADKKSSPLSGPFDVAATADKIFVTDQRRNRVAVFNHTGAFQYAFGEGRDFGALRSPAGIAAPGDGRVYIADQGNKRVAIFTEKGLYLSSIGDSKEGRITFGAPTYISIGREGTLYVVDTKERMLRILDREFQSRDSDVVNARLEAPSGVAALPDGGFAVVDEKTGVIRLYDADFQPRETFGSDGESRGQVKRPGGIACNAAGHCLVADTGNRRVQIFSTPQAPDRPKLPPASRPFRIELKDTLPYAFHDIAVTATGDIFGALGKNNDGVLVHIAPPSDSNAQSGGQWTRKAPILPPPTGMGRNGPSSVALCPDGSLVLADPSAGAIHVYAPDGTYRLSFGQSGTKQGYFSKIGGVACGPGAVYVADTGNFRVQMFSPTGVFRGAFGVKGIGPGQFKSPIDVAVTSTGDVWVADNGNGTVQLFSSKGALKAVLGDRMGRTTQRRRTLSLMLADDDTPTRPTKGGKAEPHFPGVEAIAVDADDFVFVRERGRMHVYDSGGVRLLSFGSPGAGTQEWEAGGGIAVRQSAILIPDPKNGRTVIYTLGRIPDIPHDFALTPGIGHSTLTWAPSPESFVTSYHVYAINAAGNAEPLGTTPEPKYVVDYPPEGGSSRFFVTAVSTRGLESGRAGPVTDFFQLGYLAYENGDLETALTYFTDALRAQPNTPLLLEYKGKTLLAQGKSEEAQTVFKQLLTVPNGKPAGYRSLGLMALAHGDFAGAEQELERARAANPRDSATLMAQAELYLAKRQYYKARERAQQSVGRGRQEPRAHELIGLAYAGEKLYGKAAQSLARAIDLAPDRTRLYRELADMHLARHDAAAARATLADALRRFPKNPDLRLARAGVALDTGEFDAADREINDVLADHPENPQAHLLRGRLFAAQHRSEDAIAEFGSARALAPHNPDVLLALAQAYAAAGLGGEAQNALTDLFTVDTNNQDALLLAGRLYLEAGAFDDAERAADKCIALNPGNAQAYALKGDVAMRKDTPAVAVGHYRKAGQLQPENTGILLAEAEALVAAKREADARKVYGKVLRVDSSNAEAHHALGVLLRESYEFEPAIEELNLATYLTPGDADYHNDLGLAYLGAYQHDDAIAAFNEALRLKPGEAQYKHNLDKAYTSKKTYRRSGNLPALELRATGFGTIYAAAAQSYQTRPAGQVHIKNLSDTLFYNIKVSFMAPLYMNAPFEVKVPELKPHATRTIDIRPTLNNTVLTLSENKPVVGKVTVTYVQNKRARTLTNTVPFTLYSPNALTWSDKAMTGAFITPKDWPVNEFARATLAAYAEGDDAAAQVAGSEAVAKAMLLYDALTVYRMRYLEDPNQPFATSSMNYEAVDYVQFPRDTLRLKSGDCDDLVMLYASLLENVGIATGILDLPGHVMVLFDTGIPEARASALSDSSRDYIIREDRAWLPVEMTVVGKSFTEAWATGAEIYNERKSKGVTIIDTNASWNTYAPVSLPLTQFRPEVPTRASMDTVVAEERRRFAGRRLERLTAPLRAKLLKKPNDANLRLRLGTLLASQGLMDAAREEFSAVLNQHPKHADALVNLGNLSFIERDYSAALEYYREAEAASPSDAQVKFNLALAYYRIGSRDEAKAKFGEAAEIDPDLGQANAHFKALLDK